MEKNKKLELTLCSMFPYCIEVMHTEFSDEGAYTKKQKVTAIYNDCVGFESSCDYYFDDPQDNECEIKPLLHSLDKLTEPILEGGLIPFDVLRLNYPKVMEDFGFALVKEGFWSIRKNAPVEIQFIPFGIIEKLKEYHFNIYDLPKDMYIEKSEVKQ